MIYILVLCYILFFLWRYPSFTRKASYAYWSICVILILISGLRYNVGIDTFYYTQRHVNFPKLQELDSTFLSNTNYKILWIVFESSIRTITDSFYVLQFLLAIFVNYIVFRTIKLFSVSPFLTVLFYYLLFYVNLNMEILRESIPICFLLLSVNLILEKKYFYFYILSIIAFFFHESGVVLFLLPFLFRFKIQKGTYFLLIILLFIFSGLLSTYFVEHLDSLQFLFSEDKFVYFEEIKPENDFQVLHIIKFIILPTIILYLFYDNLFDYERKFIFSYIIFSIFFLHFFIFYRPRDYFFLMFLIATTNGLIKTFGKKRNTLSDLIKPAFIFLFIGIFLFRFYYHVNPGVKYQSFLNYYPYRFILNEEIPPSRFENIKNYKNL